MFENNAAETQANLGRFLAAREGAFATARFAAPVIDIDALSERVIRGRKVDSLSLFRRVRPNPATAGGLTAA